jgi:hypothetical protein
LVNLGIDALQRSHLYLIGIKHDQMGLALGWSWVEERFDFLEHGHNSTAFPK